MVNNYFFNYLIIFFLIENQKLWDVRITFLGSFDNSFVQIYHGLLKYFDYLLLQAIFRYLSTFIASAHIDLILDYLRLDPNYVEYRRADDN